MATDNKKATAKPTKPKGPSPEEVYAGFQQLRIEQRNLISRLSEVELDLNEHKIVVDTLVDLDGDRKCFRLVGGVLCEKTVKEVLPVLTNNKEQLTNLVKSLNEQVTKKGAEINEYKKKHNLRIRGQDDIPAGSSQESGDSKPSEVLGTDASSDPRKMVMVINNEPSTGV